MSTGHHERYVVSSVGSLLSLILHEGSARLQGTYTSVASRLWQADLHLAPASVSKLLPMLEEAKP